jgi:glycosyltransferase involved in cell wall biosynthesis
MSIDISKARPKVTVAVITYNQADLLKEALDSILSQVTKYTYEILICDDASTDDTEIVSHEYENKYSGVVKYHRLEKNSGITANSNQGIRHASGEYIAFIGGDDLFLPNKIEIQTAFMDQNPDITISYHPVDIFDSSSGKTLLITNQSAADTPKTLLELAQICIPGAMSIMVRRDSIPLGGFDARLRMVSDWLFFIEVAHKGGIAFIPNLLARYRKHGNQASFKTYELLNESMKNLDYAMEKLGSNVIGLDSAIRIGKARYLSGEAYRQMLLGNKALARSLMKSAFKYNFKLVYIIGFISTYMPVPVGFLKNIKHLLKKYF